MKFIVFLLSILFVQLASAEVNWLYNDCSQAREMPYSPTENIVLKINYHLPNGLISPEKLIFASKSAKFDVTFKNRSFPGTRIWKVTAPDSTDIFYDEFSFYPDVKYRIVTVRKVNALKDAESYDVHFYERSRTEYVRVHRLKDESWMSQTLETCRKNPLVEVQNNQSFEGAINYADPDFLKKVEMFVPGFKNITTGKMVLFPDARVGVVKRVKNGRADVSITHSLHTYEIGTMASQVPVVDLSPATRCAGGKCMDDSLLDYQCESGKIVTAFANGTVLSHYRRHGKSFVLKVRGDIGYSYVFPNRDLECTPGELK